MKNAIKIVFAVVLCLIGFVLTGCNNKDTANSRSENVAPSENAAPENSAPPELTEHALRELVSPCSEPVIADYLYTNTGTITDYHTLLGIKVPFSTETVEYTYSGTIRAGIDLYNVSFDVNDNNKTIYITLPKAYTIFHKVDLDSFQTETIKNSWFNSIETEECITAATANKADMEANAKENGCLYKQAEFNAEEALRKILNHSDITQGYHYQFIPAA